MNDFNEDVRGPDDEPGRPRDPEWLNPPTDILAGTVPIDMIIGQSDNAVLTITGMAAFPGGVAMTFGVHLRWVSRGSIFEEVFDGPYARPRDDAWRKTRLEWGFELADGTTATNVNTTWMDAQTAPTSPVLSGGGGSGDEWTVQRSYWLWPLPPAAKATVRSQWPELGIRRTTQTIDTSIILDAATRARPLWPPSDTIR